MKTNIKSGFRVLFFLLITLLCFEYNGNAEELQTAPDFNLKDLSGNNISIKQLRGNTVLLNFWATWCPYCRKSIAELVDLQKRYKNKGLIILGITTEHRGQVNDKTLIAFKNKYKINYSILRANRDILQKYFHNRRMALPTTFFINSDGKVAYVNTGFRPGVIEKIIKKVL